MQAAGMPIVLLDRAHATLPCDHDRRRRGRPDGGRAPAGARPPADRLRRRRGGEPVRVRLQRRTGARASRRRWPPRASRSRRSWILRRPHGRDAARVAAAELLAREPAADGRLRRPPTCRRSGCWRRRRRRACRCPSELSVIGFDNVEAAGYTGLTTVAQPLEESGASAPTCCCARCPARRSQAAGCRSRSSSGARPRPLGWRSSRVRGTESRPDTVGRPTEEGFTSEM